MRWPAFIMFIMVVGGILTACEQAPPAGLGAPAPTPPSGGPAWFEDSAAAAGLDFTWHSGHDGVRFFMPESAGGGGGLFDMDGDGDLDVYCVQAGAIEGPASARETNRLFENLGDGTFRDVTEASGTGDRGYGMGLAAADYDGDGDNDLLVTNLGPDVLYRNNGDGTFTDVTTAAGINAPGWSTSAAFFDYDRDGDLDLYLLQYMLWSTSTEIECFNSLGVLDYCSPKNYNAPARDFLYRNEGNGTFTDVTVPAGMTTAVGTGLGVIAGDFNGDGWPDLFIANDGMPDQLWFNRRNGTFIEFGMNLGVALDQEGKSKAGMGVTAADIDDDADLDVMVCNLRSESDSFFLNEGQYFSDHTILSGVSSISRAFTRFGMGWVDFDNDGYLDLYQANGRVESTAATHGEDPYAEPNVLFRGHGPRFEEVHPRGGTTPPLVHSSRAAAFGDVDNDGGMDILVINRDGPAYLLRNVYPARGHWLTLRVLDENGRDSIGAFVQCQIGERTVRRDVRPAYSYCATNDPRVHFGLGEQSGPVTVRVVWPDGLVEEFTGLEVDQVTEVHRGRGRAQG